MKIAVIPARGGSKRIPRKNIRPFSGRPMIAWSIETARATGLFDRIMVSTDDREIAAISEQCGAEVPFTRPAELANDHAGATSVISHATRWALDQGMQIDAVCCILATAPFTRAGDIGAGCRILETVPCDYVFAATEFAAPIYRSFTQLPGGGLTMTFPEHFATRSQDLPTALHDAAQFYWGRPQAWLEERRVFGENSRIVMIPRWRVQDIDTEDDWTRAELLAPVVRRELRGDGR